MNFILKKMRLVDMIILSLFTGVESYSWLSNTTLKLNGPSSEKSVILNLEDKPENIKNVLDEAEKFQKICN